MTKLLITIAVAALFLFGCQDQNSVVEPAKQSVQQPKTEKHWIAFTENQKNSVEGTQTWSKSITGNLGGYFKGTKDLSPTVSAYVEIWVPDGAYLGTKTISATLSSETLTADFSPSPMTFDKPIYYTVEYFGVDLSGINKDEIDFYYVAEDGSLQKAEYAELYVEDDWLCVVDAKLPHFSRYGFVN